MKFAFFAGCKIPYYLPEYEKSTKAVLKALDIKIVNIEFNCCGYPIRHQNFLASVLFAARNMALAQKENLNILTPCKCCYGNLKHAQYWLSQNNTLLNEINDHLSSENLRLDNGTVEVKHLLSVLLHDVGIDAIKSKVINPQHNLRVAAHYGCHALRPSNIMQFDDPFSPTIFEKLVEVTGAEAVNWSRRLECCGNPLWEKNRSLSLKIMQQKLNSARDSGATHLCTSCTYCQIHFDSICNSYLKDKFQTNKLPAILYPQLLGVSFGIEKKVLGVIENKF